MAVTRTRISFFDRIIMAIVASGVAVMLMYLLIIIGVEAVALWRCFT